MTSTAPDAPLIARTIAALDSYAVDEFGEADEEDMWDRFDRMAEG